MTTPLQPPGLSLSHLSSRLALSTPSILSLVLTHLVDLSRSTSNATDTDADTLHPSSAPPHYALLRCAALVARSWAEEAQRLLQAEAHFWGGDAQLGAWVSSVSSLDVRSGSGGRKNTRAFFADRLPVVLADKRGGGGKAKWSKEGLREACERLRGVERLVVGFGWTREGEGEWFLGEEGFKSLTHLILLCPLSPPPSLFPFRLSYLSLITSPCALSLPGAGSRWLSTLSALAPALTALQTLDLSSWPASSPSSLPLPLPVDALFFPHIFPAAHTLTALSLPSLPLSPSSWRLALFACACTSLHRLSIAHLGGAGAAEGVREVLPAFWQRAPLRELVFERVGLALGTGVVHRSLLEWDDPLEALKEVLCKWPEEAVPSEFETSCSSESAAEPSSRSTSPTPTVVSLSSPSPAALDAEGGGEMKGADGDNQLDTVSSPPPSPSPSRRCTLRTLILESVKYKDPSYEAVERLAEVAVGCGVGRVVYPLPPKEGEEGEREGALSEEEAARLDALLATHRVKRAVAQERFNQQVQDMLKVIQRDQDKDEAGDEREGKREPRVFHLDSGGFDLEVEFTVGAKKEGEGEKGEEKEEEGEKKEGEA
ncbi:hypothetical protein JCM6882_004534 [Rhodosporidiobolus microsporus]